MKRYILHLSDVFFDEEFSDGEGIDLRDVESVNCYCAPQSADVLRERLKDIPAQALHWIDTGDYHYLTLFFLEKLKEPFNLVLIDNHPDDQQTAFGGDILSCGSWVAEARKLPFCKETIWIRDEADFTLPEQDAVYLSIDLDVLSPDFARTNWDQGSMTMAQLCGIVRRLMEERRVAGADICGGISESQGAMTCDLAINRDAVDTVCGLFR